MKKNFRNVPSDVHAKLKAIKSDEIVVGCAVKYKSEALLSGKLKHLGVLLTPSGLELPAAIVPKAEQGKFSNQNVNGLEIIRKDLPKETHYNSIESPNWGDSYNGTHTVNLPYKKYPREFRSPRVLEITMFCADTRPGLSVYVIAFQVKEVLSKAARNFGTKLFENLNLLQENAGACGVQAASESLSDYTKSLHVSWEILPPGTVEETIERLFRGETPTTQDKDVATERYQFFSSLKPKSLVYGNSGFSRYFGALIKDDLVVFENIQYGNAVYILFENWEELSKRSRVDLISGKFGNTFDRVIHQSGWKGKVKAIVESRCNGKK